MNKLSNIIRNKFYCKNKRKILFINNPNMLITKASYFNLKIDLTDLYKIDKTKINYKKKNAGIFCVLDNIIYVELKNKPKDWIDKFSKICLRLGDDTNIQFLKEKLNKFK